MAKTLAKVVKGRRGNPVKDQLSDKSGDIFLVHESTFVHIHVCNIYVYA